MPVEMRGRHYRSAPRTQATTQGCPNCGVPYTGPVSEGCQNCGAGNPSKGKSAPRPTDPRYQAPGGLSKQDVAQTVVEVLQQLGMVPATRRTITQAEEQALAMEEGSSALGDGYGEEVEPPAGAPYMRAPVQSDALLAARRTIAAPVAPLALPDVNTGDPRVRKTVAMLLFEYGSYAETAEGCLTPEEAQNLALKIDPTLDGQMVEPSPEEVEAAVEQVQVQDQAASERRASFLSRVLAPNSKRQE